MNLQAVIVAVIVVACAGYAVWTLMPAAGQRVMAGALLRLPMPAWLTAPLRRAEVKAAAGCGGCGSCSAGPSGKKAAAQPITFHPRRR